MIEIFGGQTLGSTRHVRERVRRWLDGRISLREFEEWFVAVAGTAAEGGDDELVVASIDMNLSELDDGVLTGEEFRKQMAGLA
ncbi:MAG: hypothetical protein JNK87_06455 [Bryobacterales bacterium]|nr:hypothetical protein [Bryobacterales bacterium]